MVKVRKKKDTSKRDPNNASEWPVDKYPYVVHRPYAEDSYRTSFKDAINHLRSGVNGLKAQFTDMDTEVVEACNEILEAIGQLSADGGTIDMIAVPYNKVRYRAQLVRREQIL